MTSRRGLLVCALLSLTNLVRLFRQTPEPLVIRVVSYDHETDQRSRLQVLHREAATPREALKFVDDLTHADLTRAIALADFVGTSKTIDDDSLRAVDADGGRLFGGILETQDPFVLIVLAADRDEYLILCVGDYDPEEIAKYARRLVADGLRADPPYGYERNPEWNNPFNTEELWGI